jgi:predicted metal-dependent hydrolase
MSPHFKAAGPAPQRADRAAGPFLDTLRLTDGRELTLRVEINPRARRISVRLDPVTRHVVAVAPAPRHAPEAAAFARTRLGWVAAQLARLPQVIHLEPGATIPLRGAPVRLVQQPGSGPVQIAGDTLLAPGWDPTLFAGRVRRFLHAEARADLIARVKTHAAALEVTPRRLTVKDTASRWGSCTTAGALNFSWRVVLAPPFVLDYLAAHEVAHLREMNHSARFWRLVAHCIPDFQRAETWLERHGAGLHGIDPKR